MQLQPLGTGGATDGAATPDVLLVPPAVSEALWSPLTTIVCATWRLICLGRHGLSSVSRKTIVALSGAEMDRRLTVVSIKSSISKTGRSGNGLQWRGMWAVEGTWVVLLLQVVVLMVIN